MGERVGKELRTQSSIIASEAESPLANCCEGTEEEPTAKNLVITIHLKKMEPSGTNPNQLDPKDELNPKPSVSKSGVVEPYNGLYNVFKNNKTSNSSDSNGKGVSTSYPIVTPSMAPKSSECQTLNDDANCNITNNSSDHKSSSGKTRIFLMKEREIPQIFEISRRFNPEDYPIEDCDERARIKRAIEIAEGVEIDHALPTNLSIEAQPLKNMQQKHQLHANQMLQLNPTPQLAATLSQQSQSQSQNPCFLCSTDLFNFQQFGINGHPNGEIPRIHSQDYYMHCLVPDLQKITACCFYWGKMDRYEAEKLLDGKPEGTFLLRDSAQDDFLFSVSFRKYGRSLHARIEQFNHLFSFDSHDPSVFTAPTVTALLEHYKDPTCVMFFEPMLTINLNRSFCFSLASLSRAAIVSNCTYDGLNELCLPPAMKSFLREYHYKQRVRVKRFDEHIYANS